MIFSSFKRTFAGVCLGLALASTSGTAWAQMERETQSAEGKALSIRYFVRDAAGELSEVADPRMDISTAQVCGDSATGLNRASLWMPDHGHGSGPVDVRTVVESEGKCHWLEGLEFLMPGRWELRLQLGAQDSAVFSLEVAGG